MSIMLHRTAQSLNSTIKVKEYLPALYEAMNAVLGHMNHRNTLTKNQI